MENVMNRINTAEFKKNYEVSNEIFYKKVKAIEEELNLQDQMTDEAKAYLELVKNEALLKEFIALDKKEDAKALLAKHGLPFSDEEIDQLVASINDYTGKLIENNGELTEDELEMIAGGGFGSWLKGRFSSAGKALITVGAAIVIIGAVVATGGLVAAAFVGATAAVATTIAGGAAVAATGLAVRLTGDFIESK